MNCSFCGAWEFGKEQAYISFEEAAAALKAARKEGYRITTLTGGEPTINENFEKIIQYAHSLGYWTVVTTNGLYLTDEMINTYKKCKTLVRVSLHTLDPSLHEEITGGNTLADITENMQKMSANGIRLGIGCTVFDKNISEIHSLASFAWENNASFIRYTPVVGIRGADNIHLEYDFFRTLLTEISKMCAENYDLLEHSSYSREYAEQITEYMLTRRCAGGTNQHIIYDCHGTVIPCSFIPEEAGLGCVSQNESISERFGKVYKNMTAFFNDEFTAKLEGSCGKCIYKTSCRGGCLTMKIPPGLSPNAEQPVCMYRLISGICSNYSPEDSHKLMNYWCSNFLQKTGPNDRDKVCIRRLPIWELNFSHNIDRTQHKIR